MTNKCDAEVEKPVNGVTLLTKNWQSSLMFGVLLAASIGTVLFFNHFETASSEWRKAMFAATTSLGVDDRDNADAIKLFATSYGKCVFSPPPEFDTECVELAINRMTAARSEAASPERVRAEREVVLSLLDHVNAPEAFTP